jgi:AP-3 complex subunit delta-1
MKLFSNIVTTHLKQDEIEKAQELGNVLEEALNGLLSSSDLEVQERASVMQQFIKYIIKHISKGDGESLKHDLTVFFCGDLNPVASKAQKKVPLPEGLDFQ